jgi:hypothetical protein
MRVCPDGGSEDFSQHAYEKNDIDHVNIPCSRNDLNTIPSITIQ